MPGVQRRLQSQLAGDVGHDLGVDAKHLAAEALVKLDPDGILGQRAEALKFAVLEVGVDRGGGRPRVEFRSSPPHPGIRERRHPWNIEFVPRDTVQAAIVDGPEYELFREYDAPLPGRARLYDNPLLPIAFVRLE